MGMAEVVESHTWESCPFCQLAKGVGKGSRCPRSTVHMAKHQGLYTGAGYCGEIWLVSMALRRGMEAGMATPQETPSIGSEKGKQYGCGQRVKAYPYPSITGPSKVGPE